MDGQTAILSILGWAVGTTVGTYLGLRYGVRIVDSVIGAVDRVLKS